jgi:hypothetical protein
LMKLSKAMHKLGGIQKLTRKPVTDARRISRSAS